MMTLVPSDRRETTRGAQRAPVEICCDAGDEAARRTVVDGSLIGMVDSQIRNMNPFDTGHAGGGLPEGHIVRSSPRVLRLPAVLSCRTAPIFRAYRHQCGCCLSGEHLHQRRNFGCGATPEFALVFDDDIPAVNAHCAQRCRKKEVSVGACRACNMGKKPVGNGEPLFAQKQVPAGEENCCRTVIMFLLKGRAHDACDPSDE